MQTTDTFIGNQECKTDLFHSSVNSCTRIEFICISEKKKKKTKLFALVCEAGLNKSIKQMPVFYPVILFYDKNTFRLNKTANKDSREMRKNGLFPARMLNK